MGLGAVSYGIQFENKPKRIVVTDVNEDRINRAREVISEEHAKEMGLELHYVNTAGMADPIAELMAITQDRPTASLRRKSTSITVTTQARISWEHQGEIRMT